MTTPPRATERLLHALSASSEFRDDLLGDMAEEFTLRATYDGVGAARRWYRREAWRAAPHLIRDWLRHIGARDVRRVARVALTVFVMQQLLSLAVFVGGRLMVTSLGSVEFRAAGPFALALIVAYRFVATAAGGYLAAWLDTRTPLLSALAIGVLWSCVRLATLAAYDVGPGWFEGVVALIVIAGTLAGGALRVVTTGRAAESSSRLQAR